MVYVDDANISKHGRVWFHLTADSVDELRAFADRIGLDDRAFHRGARHPHYDITAAQRVNAIRDGAHAVSARDIVRISRGFFRAPNAVAAPTSEAQLVLFI